MVTMIVGDVLRNRHRQITGFAWVSGTSDDGSPYLTKEDEVKLRAIRFTRRDALRA